MIGIEQILIKVKELESVFVILGADERASLNAKFDQIAKENGLEKIEKDIRFIATIRNAIVHDGDTFKIDKRIDEGFRRCYNNVKKALNWQGDLKLVSVDKTKSSVVSTKELLKMTSEIESLLETLGAKEEQGSGLVQKFKTIRVAYDLEFLRPQMDKVVEIRNDCVHKIGEFALSQEEFDEFLQSYNKLTKELTKAINNGVKSDDEIKKLTTIKNISKTVNKIKKRNANNYASINFNKRNKIFKPKTQYKKYSKNYYDKKSDKNKLLAIFYLILFIVLMIAVSFK